MENIIDRLRSIIKNGIHADNEKFNETLYYGDIKEIVETIDNLYKELQHFDETNAYLQDYIRLLKNENDMIKRIKG